MNTLQSLSGLAQGGFAGPAHGRSRGWLHKLSAMLLAGVCLALALIAWRMGAQAQGAAPHTRLFSYTEQRSWQIANDAVKIWDGGGTTNNWSDCVNWSDDTCPTSVDTVTFNGTSTKNVTIDTVIHVAGVNIYNTYPGIITQGAAVTVGSVGWTQSGATFAGGSAKMSISGAFVLAGGTFTATSGTMTLSLGNYNFSNASPVPIFVQSAGTFTHNGGLIVFATIYGGCFSDFVIDINFSLVLNNVEFAGDNADCGDARINYITAANDVLIVGGDLTHTNGKLGAVIQLQGNMTIATGADGGVGTVTYTGVTNQTYSSAVGGKTAGFVISKASGSVSPTIGTTSLVIDTFVLAHGTYLAPSGTFTINSNLTSSKVVFSQSGSGVFSHNGGTLQFAARSALCSVIATIDVNATLVLNNVEFAGEDECGNERITYATAAGDTVIAAGTLSFTAEKVNGQWEAQGNTTIGANAKGGAASIAFTGGNNQTFTDNGGTKPTGTVYVNKTGGAVSLAQNTSWNATGQKLTLSGGTLDLNGRDLTVNSALTVQSGGTLKLKGTETVARGSLSLNAGSAVFYSPASVLTSALTLGNTYSHFVAGGTGSITLVSALTVNKNLTVSGGTLKTDGKAVTVTNTLAVRSGATLQIKGSESISRGALSLEQGGTVFYRPQSAVTGLVLGNTYASRLVFGGTGSVTLDAALTAASVTLSGGTLDVSGSSHAVTLSGSWLRTGGTFTPRFGTVMFNRSSGVQTLNDGSTTFHNIGHNGAGTLRLSGNALAVGNDLTQSAGTFDANSLGTTVSGLTTVSGGTYLASIGTQSLNGGLTISGGTFTGSAGSVAVSDLTLSSGTLNAPSGSFTVSGNWSQPGGTFVPGSGTVTFNGVSQTLNSGGTGAGHAFNHVAVHSSGLVGYWKFDETAAGSTVADSSGSGTDGTPVGTGGAQNLPQPSSDVPPVHFSDARSLSFDGTDDAIATAATSKLNLKNITMAAWVKPTGLGGYQRVIDKGYYGNNFTMLLSGEKLTYVINNNAGYFNHSNTSVVNGAWTHIVVVFNDDTDTVKFYINGVLDQSQYTDTSSIPAVTAPVYIGPHSESNQYFRGLIDDVRIYDRALSSTEVASLAAGNDARVLLSGNALDVEGKLTVRNGAFLPGSNAVTVGGLNMQGGTYSGGTLDVNGTMIATGGTLIAPTTTTVSGSWVKGTNATFTPGTGTVRLDGGNQTLSGSTTFYNLAKSGSTTATLTAVAGTTQTVLHSLTLRGANGAPLALRSSVTGTQWRIDPQGTRDIASVSVKDSNNLSATAITCDNDCVNAGNNTNWLFPWTGTVYSDEGVTPIGAGKTVAVSVDGGVPTTATTNAGGQFSIPKAASGGNVVALYLDNGSEKAAVVTVTDGVTLGGMNLYQNRLILRHESGSGITNANLAAADNVGDADLTDFYLATGNNVVFSLGREVLVWAGKTYRPGGTAAFDDVDIDGAARFGTGTVLVSGSFDATGGTFTSSGTVTFDSASTESIITNSRKFTNLTVNGVGGRWNMGGPLAVSGALTLANGTLDLAGQPLSNRGGTFSNDATLMLLGSESVAGFTNDSDSGTVVYAGSGSYAGLAAGSTYQNLAFSGAGTWTLGGALTANGSITLTGGTLDVSAGNHAVTVGGDWRNTRPAATFVKRAGTVTFAGTGTIVSDEPFQNLTVSGTGRTVRLGGPLNLSGSLRLSAGTLSPSGSALTASGLTVSGGGFLGSAGAVTIQNSVLLTSGTFSAPTGSFTVGHHWTKKSAATFASGSGTVTLNGANQTLSGSTTFWNLSKSVTSAATLTFAAGTTQTVRGTWTAQGAAGNLLSLRSSQTGTQWRIDPQATRTLSFVDVRDSNNTNALTVLCSADCVNSGNNSNWAFPITVTAYSDSGTTLLGAGKTVAVAVNGGTKTTAVTNVSSVASFTTVGLSPGDVVTMWLDDEEQDAVTVTVTNASSLAFDLYKDYLIVEHEYGSAITNPHLATAAGVADADVDAVYTMSGTSLTVRDGKTLRVKSGSTYQAGGSVTVDDIEIRGTFAMGTNAVRVNGSWDAAGGSFNGNNTVTFASAAPESITSNGSAFRNVIFSVQGTDARWDTTDALTVSGTQSVQNPDGTTDTTPPTISNVTAALITQSGALVRWTTNESASSRVVFGTASGALTGVGTGTTNLNLNHAVVLTGLTASTPYYYRVVSRDLAGNTATGSLLNFTTAASAGEGDEASQSGGGTVYRPPDKCAGEHAGPRLAITDVLATPHATQTGATATVTWTTNTEALSLVSYGPESPQESHRYDLDVYAVAHSLTLSALEPDTTYRLQVASISRCGEIAISAETTFTSGGATQTASGSALSHSAASAEPEPSIEALRQALDKALQIAERLSGTVGVKDLQAALDQHALSLQELARLELGPLLAGQPAVEVTDTTATIRWTTDQPSDSFVSFSPDATFDGTNHAMTAGNPGESVTAHAVTLSGLTPGTKYHYRVSSTTALGTAAASDDFTFATQQQAVLVLSYSFDVLSPDTAAFRWTTNVPTSTQTLVTPYRDGTLRYDETARSDAADLVTSHAVTLRDFESGTFYDVELGGKDASGNRASKLVTRFATREDALPAEISRVQMDTALIPGKESKIQAVVSWTTSKLSTGTIHYQQGVNADPDAGFALSTPTDPNFTRRHVVLLPGLDPGTVYGFQVESVDSAGVATRSKTFTILTPRQEESVFQVIMAQMEDTFGWVGKLRGTSP